MELSWFQSLLYGLISGFAEFLPVSAVAHQALFLKLSGGGDNALLRFSVHLGSLIAVLILCMPVLTRLHREKRIASMPRSRRRRQPDHAALMQRRVLQTAAVSMLVLLAGYGLVWNLYERLWLLAIFLGINGFALYLPTLMPSANKGAQSMSSLDAMLIGIASGLGMVPGISRVGCGVSVALLRGTDRQYALELSMLLSIPALLALAVIEMAGFVMAGTLAVNAGVVLCCISAAAASFAASYGAMLLMRFLAVKVGFSGFAYYSWGVALFALIIYLI